MARPARRSGASSEKSRPSVFWPLAAIVVPLTGLFARIEIIDGHKLPREGAYVLAPSHSTEFDPLIVAVAVWRMGRAPHFMAKESLFKVPVLGWALRATGMVPVARSSSSTSARQTLDASELLVEHGRGVIVYPEGTLTRDPDLWPMVGKTGAARIALATRCPVIPVAQWGPQKILEPYGKRPKLLPRKTMRVSAGPPVDLSDLHDRPRTGEVLREATNRIMAAITVELEQIRSEKAPLERFDARKHGLPETGRFRRPDGESA